jgi:hypothetical protein
MITKQELSHDGETTILRTTVDCSEAIEQAREVTRAGGSGKTLRPLGFIPPEMWSYNMHLRAAQECASHGDKAGYARNVKKFFDFNPAFAVHGDHQKRIWQMG